MRIKTGLTKLELNILTAMLGRKPRIIHDKGKLNPPQLDKLLDIGFIKKHDPEGPIFKDCAYTLTDYGRAYLLLFQAGK